MVGKQGRHNVWEDITQGPMLNARERPAKDRKERLCCVSLASFFSGGDTSRLIPGQHLCFRNILGTESVKACGLLGNAESRCFGHWEKEAFIPLIGKLARKPSVRGGKKIKTVLPVFFPVH